MMYVMLRVIACYPSLPIATATGHRSPTKLRESQAFKGSKH
jgi:hypothetical protein